MAAAQRRPSLMTQVVRPGATSRRRARRGSVMDAQAVELFGLLSRLLTRVHVEELIPSRVAFALASPRVRTLSLRSIAETW
jgi:hypothetical protein